jgi:hydrogenase maturation protein HypF
VERFLARLPAEAPPLASVDRVVAEGRQPVGHSGFQIVESPRGETADAQIAPDSATCADCLAELFDPHDRRHRYPFVNCTNCGPRFTIVRGIPYDRPQTTMAGFRMCARCQAEYDDPADRRFHAQPNACPVCGPSLSLRDPDGAERELGEARDAVHAAATALRDGAIAAIKGIGGYHLACRADDEQAVSRLRARKHREDRPFALMAASLADVEALARIGPTERALLDGRERPIVLAPRRSDAAVAPSVAPGLPERARAPDRDRAPALGRGRRRCGRAPLPGARRDAALLAAPPPGVVRRRRANALPAGAGDDQRQCVG